MCDYTSMNIWDQVHIVAMKCIRMYAHDWMKAVGLHA